MLFIAAAVGIAMALPVLIMGTFASDLYDVFREVKDKQDVAVQPEDNVKS